jgi:hypothetical protein
LRQSINVYKYLTSKSPIYFSDKKQKEGAEEEEEEFNPLPNLDTLAYF